jgi:subtilisin
MNVDVAILDTGIDPRHPDLNVFQSISFAGGRTGDQNGHGTHVAGIIGAKDNTIGVVGVAPGARLWAVRVLNRNGGGSWADIVDGIDWVAARSQQIEVVNISLSGGVDDDNSIIRTAINGLVDAGITVVAAAGNANRQGQQDVSEIIPARYPNVIAVSALADNNGEGGSSSGLFKVAGSYYEFDESLANFSNYGSAMSLIAPGVSILSTYKNRKYAVVSGTSQAAPHVSGAAALYRIMNPEARPQDVRTALRAAGTVFSRSDDPDLVYEPALDVSGL